MLRIIAQCLRLPQNKHGKDVPLCRTVESPLIKYDNSFGATKDKQMEMIRAPM